MSRLVFGLLCVALSLLPPIVAAIAPYSGVVATTRSVANALDAANSAQAAARNRLVDVIISSELVCGVRAEQELELEP